jgi:hypothetical protein
MARNTLPRFVNKPKNYMAAITANTEAEIFTAPTGGARIGSLSFATDNSASMTASILIEDTAAATFNFGAVAVTSAAGTVGAGGSPNPNIDGLNATDFPGLPDDGHGNPFVDIAEGCKLKVLPAGLTTSASRTLYVTAIAYELEADS